MGWVRGVCALVAWVGLGFACSSSSQSGGAAGAAGSDAGSVADPCASCAIERCQQAREACQAEASCVAHLDCLRACPADAAGIDPACVNACPKGTTSAAQEAAAALDSCANAAASSCTECAPSDAGSDVQTQPPTNPVLAQQCTPITHEDACNQCLWNHCCDSMDAILEPGPTADFADCWQNCTTADCEKDCYANHPDGIVGFGGWWGCLSHHCMKSGDCPATTPCTQCVADHCSLELTNCQTNLDCHLTMQCVSWCETTQCALACPAQWPDAATEWDAYTACVAQRCNTVCS